MGKVKSYFKWTVTRLYVQVGAALAMEPTRRRYLPTVIHNRRVRCVL